MTRVSTPESVKTCTTFIRWTDSLCKLFVVLASAIKEPQNGQSTEKRRPL